MAAYRQPILEFFINCRDWKTIKKCLDTSTRRSFRTYINVRQQEASDLYAGQIAHYDQLAKLMADGNARWAKRYRMHWQKAAQAKTVKQLELKL